jgi:hypothetical protein
MTLLYATNVTPNHHPGNHLAPRKLAPRSHPHSVTNKLLRPAGHDAPSVGPPENWTAPAESVTKPPPLELVTVTNFLVDPFTALSVWEYLAQG